MMRFYALEILRIGLGFTGRFPYAGELQILLLKTSPKQASEEGRIMTDQTLGRSNSGPVRLPVHHSLYLPHRTLLLARPHTHIHK